MNFKKRNSKSCKKIKISFCLPVCFILIVCTFSCKSQPARKAGVKINDERIFKKASHNADVANEGFIRSNKYMEAWLSYADPKSKLVPRVLYKEDPDNDIWNGKDCAADNYPFMVLTSFFTNQQMFHGIMRKMLDNETRLTSRVRSLPDTYSFSKKSFKYDSVSKARIVFGASEYIKDGLLPVTEWLGRSPWSKRMVTMLTDLNEYIAEDHADHVAKGFGEKDYGSSPLLEVNGEMLESLSRNYWMTGEQKYLKWAEDIGDYFLLGKGYPLNLGYIRLRDHGSEMIGGLSELYATLSFVDKSKKNAYKKPLHKLLDYILKYGRNKDGLFYNAIDPQNDKIVDEGISDGWGYVLSGYYTVYMIDHVERYKNAVTSIFSNLHKYRNYNWERGGADGFADAIEGAIDLHNKVPGKQAANWIDSQTQVMWSLQDSSYRKDAQQYKNEGIIEGWYGDGNFARTTIMYNLWKSKGAYLQPWNRQIKLGAEMKGDTLFFVVKSTSPVPWKGKIYFDKKRHSIQMHLPLNWPRINQFPEWFTIKPSSRYKLIEVKNKNEEDLIEKLDGKSILSNSIPVTIKANQTRKFKLLPLNLF